MKSFLILAFVAAPALAESYQFIGCRPSVGECYSSCPNQKGQGLMTDQDHPECADTYNEPVSCYCEVSSTPAPSDPFSPQDPEVPGDWFKNDRR